MSALDDQFAGVPDKPATNAPTSRWAASIANEIDFALIALILIPIGLLVADPTKLVPVLRGTKNEVLETLPFMAIAVTAASATLAIGAESLIARATSQREATMVILFAIAGALMPFCSCGVIPVIASLLAAGVPLAPVMAFWMSSPLMDPNHFFITASALGWEFAVARATAAVGLGLFSGYATMVFVRTIGFKNPLKVRVKLAGANRYDRNTTVAIRWQFWKERARSQLFVSHWIKTFWFLLKWLALAFLVEGLMIAYLPPMTIASWMHGRGAMEIPLAGALGGIFYVNPFAAVPLISGLIQLGLSPAAGLTFIVAGGLTSIPAAMAVWVLVRPKVFFWHLALSVVGALLAGYTYAAYRLFV
ncbi:permease [Bradyrhizobium diazoefficiens]|nr:permease [Bradyrhizobium diazoefficiens]MBR0965674.1 permease [Bradyrhizobium diazoefficiens]MBR0979366.1 permease [Bradyrhizobium diazoefficiens]MBR1008558.1 permease [Bradyrhizobium diazoefficiens]MBR1014693.1 permease [Bradyrhizobium diazoefficiens]MBR1052519.1 permease [Bradyrhizobium diazoefficiens]